jgi:CubicO group peptidase (beta-lactamase class C family)
MDRLAIFHPIALFWRKVAILSLLLPLSALASDIEGISNDEIADLAQRAMEQFNVPGMAIGIVRGGKILYAEGHGIREIGQPERINADTLFKIASNTKAFTTAALAILVDEGEMAWDSPVIDFIPEFRLSDPWVTVQFTTTDLLTHRSGLPRYVGDLMLWPEPNDFVAADIIGALKHFQLISGFRTEYAYDNLLYIVAGEIIPRVTDQSWGQFVDQRIMRPLGMKRCFAGIIPEREMHNIAAPHGAVEGHLQVIERSRIARQPPTSAAAGGIVCGLSDMLVWVQTQLNRGTSPAGFKLFSIDRSRELWRPETWRNVSDRDAELHGTNFSAYGLGWRLRDVHGYKEVSHTGSLAGMHSYVVLLPELELGVVVLSNGSNSDARSAVVTAIVSSFMQVEQRDWIEQYVEFARLEREEQRAKTSGNQTAVSIGKSSLVPDATRYAGRYRDPWFGEVSITENDGSMTLSAAKSQKLSGPMQYLGDDTFIVRWTDRTVEVDAVVRFEFDQDGELISILMNREFEDMERSLDFQDLNFSRVE